MDIFQHAWSQIGLFIAIQVVFLEISKVNSFAWPSPSQFHPRTVPKETHLTSQRWQHAVPKWYPYPMWKRGRRRNDNFGDFIPDSSIVFRNFRPKIAHRNRGLVDKHRALFEKTNRHLRMNMVARGKYLNQLSSLFGTSLMSKAVKLYGRSAGKAGITPVFALTRKLKYHFGEIGSSQMPNSHKAPNQKEQKKFKGSNTGFNDDAFGSPAGGGFDAFGNFNPVNTDNGFSDDLVPVNQSPKKAKNPEVVRPSNGFSDDEFTSDVSMHMPSGHSGSWGVEGFGVMDKSSSSAISTGSLGVEGEVGAGLGSFGEDAFSDDTKDCESILSKSCATNTECSCYGFYECSQQKCTPIKAAISGQNGFKGAF